MNKDPYANQHNPYEKKNQNNKDNLKKIIKEREKDDAKKAFSKILQNFQNAKNNGMEIENNYEIIGPVRLYYYKYYYKNYLFFLFFLGILSFFSSFFNLYAMFSIPVSLIFYSLFSKKIYLINLLYVHSVDSQVKNDVYNYIFGKSNFVIFMVIGSFLSILTAISLYFTKSIFLEKFKNIPFLESLKQFQRFNIENELFAYSILLSFFILIGFKMLKK